MLGLLGASFGLKKTKRSDLWGLKERKKGHEIDKDT